MGIFFKSEPRRVIPRLRSFKLSVSTGELNVYSSNVTSLNFTVSKFLHEQKTAWINSPNFINAADLLSSAFVLGLEEHFKDVATFIINNSSDGNSPIVRLAKKTVYKEPYDISEVLNAPISNREEIKVLKHILNQEPKNPIALMEIGRLYSLEGHMEQANLNIQKALYLDKDNRFIVRSASRFYHHFSGDIEKSIYVIKKSRFLKEDPWMISAEIAYSTILGRYSKMAKVGENYIRNENYNNHSITELASALGTLEFNNGNIKTARNYLNQSLLEPNDNSLAQVIWLSENINGLFIDNSKYDMPLAFEAKTEHFYDNKQFQESFDEAMRWHMDEPYSTRPIKRASYISSVFLKQYKKSIDLLNKALEISKQDHMLTNNLIYFLVQDNQIDKAKEIYERDLRSLVEDGNNLEDRISFIATAGLIAYKSNNPIDGKMYYEKAIKIAKTLKDKHNFALATANYVKEALKYTLSFEDKQSLMDQLDNACKLNTEYDIIEFYNDAKMEFNKGK